MSISKKEIVEKVTKLFELANNDGATEGEAKAAMLKAQKIMAKYEVTPEDVEGTKKQVRKIVNMFCATHENAGYRFALGNLISNSFRCGMYMDSVTRKIVFVGFETDCKIAVEVFNYAYTFINHGACNHTAKIRREKKSTEGVWQSYAFGFIAGLKAEMDAQTKALMVVTEQEIKDRVAEICKGGKKVSSHKNISYSESFHKGVKDGQDFAKKDKKQIAK